MKVRFFTNDAETNESREIELWRNATVVPSVGATIIGRYGQEYEVKAVTFWQKDFADVWVVAVEQ